SLRLTPSQSTPFPYTTLFRSNIGSRPIDQHLKGFRALGASVDIIHGAVVAKAEELRGKHIFLDMVSVGATINIMMAAAMANGNRSEEHTSELQSRFDLVCRLL